MLCQKFLSDEEDPYHDNNLSDDYQPNKDRTSWFSEDESYKHPNRPFQKKSG